MPDPAAGAAPKKLPDASLAADSRCDQCQREVKSPLPATAYGCPCCKIRRAEKGLPETVPPTILCAACPTTDPTKTLLFGRRMDLSFKCGAVHYVDNDRLICRICIQFVAEKSSDELANLVKEKGRRSTLGTSDLARSNIPLVTRDPSPSTSARRNPRNPRFARGVWPDSCSSLAGRPRSPSR